MMIAIAELLYHKIITRLNDKFFNLIQIFVCICSFDSVLHCHPHLHHHFSQFHLRSNKTTKILPILLILLSTPCPFTALVRHNQRRSLLSILCPVRCNPPAATVRTRVSWKEECDWGEQRCNKHHHHTLLTAHHVILFLERACGSMDTVSEE